MHQKPKESDWRAFKKLVPEMRESYLRAQIEGMSSILSDEALNATERFWKLDKYSSDISKILQSCLDGHSRSKMEFFMGQMLSHGMMTQDDLAVFSSELREKMLQRVALFKE